MEHSQIIDKIEEILDDVQTGILTTIDLEQNPSSMWMVPVILKYPTTAIYCFGKPHCQMLRHIAANNKVVWTIQRDDCREIVKIQGTATVNDNHAIQTEMIDRVGPDCEKFFKADTIVEETVVIETMIERVEYYIPVEGVAETVIFSQPQQPVA
jgi:general stress protein 26